MNLSAIVLILFSVVLGVIGQLSLKQGMSAFSGNASISPAALLRMFSQPYVLLGLSLYAISAVSWLFVLSKAPLSQAYPMLSLGYVLIAVLSWWLFGEPLTLEKMAGIGLIWAGVVLLFRS